MNDYRDIENILKDYLKKKKISTLASLNLSNIEIKILTEIGLPSVLDFCFDGELVLVEEENLIIIGYLPNKGNPICINLINHEICLIVDKSFEHKIFLGETLEKFIYQIYHVYYFWNILIPKSEYQYNQLEASEIFKRKLKEIDEDLFLKDLGYYWGSMLESIEQGTVGVWK